MIKVIFRKIDSTYAKYAFFPFLDKKNNFNEILISHGVMWKKYKRVYFKNAISPPICPELPCRICYIWKLSQMLNIPLQGYATLLNDAVISMNSVDKNKELSLTVFAVRCDMWLMPMYSSKPGVNYFVGPRKPQATNGTAARSRFLRVLWKSVLYSSLYSLQCSLTSHLPWLWPSVQMANGQRASQQLSKSMSYSWAGGRHVAPRHTPCQKHTLACAPLTSPHSFLKTPSCSLKVQWHFHFMGCCAPILPTKGSHNGHSQL